MLFTFFGRRDLTLSLQGESEASTKRGNLVELMEQMSKGDKKLKTKIKHQYGNYLWIKSAYYFTFLVDETKEFSISDTTQVYMKHRSSWAISRLVLYAQIRCWDLIHLDFWNYKKSLMWIWGRAFPDVMTVHPLRIGNLTELKKSLGKICPSVNYVHCHAHRLKLILTDSLHSISKLSDFVSLM